MSHLAPKGIHKKGVLLEATACYWGQAPNPKSEDWVAIRQIFGRGNRINFRSKDSLNS